jgi:hypothetical protein
MKSPGDKIDRYVIEAALGRGGMGEVYDATDTRLGRRVALKLIVAGADADANQRMLREARAAASFEHPNAVVVYDVGEHEGATFLAMELVRGTLLRQRVGDRDVPLGRRLRWLVDVARALGAAHRHGIVHRDIKPDNVMIREDGTAKVLDFGIARRQASAVDPSAPTEAGGIATITEEGVVVGTPRYAAPEQLRGEALDGRADEFAWGVTAYELIGGALPWRAPDSVALLSQILSADPPSLAELAPDAPEPVVAAITRALAKRAEDRFPTIDEAADAIEPFADAAASSTGKRDPARPSSAPSTTPPKPTTVGRVVRGTGKVIFTFFAIVGGIIVIGLSIAIGVGISKGTIVYKRPDAGAPTIASIACQDAQIEGASREIAEAVGRAACARLATALGVDWGAEGAASPLAVKATLGDGAATVTLSIASKQAEGKGATPIDAIAAASAALVKQLSAPKLGDQEIRAWGADSAEGARRIERVWRELLLNITSNDVAAVKGLVESDPNSAWSQTIFALVVPRGTAEGRAAVERGLALVDRLPTARAHALRGTLMVVDGGDVERRKEAMALLRRSYTEAPDDGDVAALYAAVAIGYGAEEEGFGVVDRLTARFPAKSVLALHNAIGQGIERDLARDGRYLAKLRAILPETFAWEESVRWLGESGKIAEAREALAFGRKLGLSGKSADAMPLELSEAWLALAALEPPKARELCTRLLGDPRVSVSASGSAYSAASYLMEGRIVDAETAQRHAIERLRAVGTRRVAVGFALSFVQARRWLGRPAPDADLLATMATQANEIEAADWGAGRFFAEVAIARAAASPKDAKKILRDALDRVEARAAKERERFAQDGARMSAIALVRAARGDAGVAKLWAEADHAPFDTRRFAAIDAALSLEALGLRAAAMEAYELAISARNIERYALASMIARIRLAPLLRASGKPERASELSAVVDRLWAKADPGLRDAVLKMR